MFGTFYLNPAKLAPKGILVHSIIAGQFFYIGEDVRLITVHIKELFLRVQVAHHLYLKAADGEYNGNLGAKRYELDQIDLTTHFANSLTFQKAELIKQLDDLQATDKHFRLHNTLEFYTVQGHLAKLAATQASLAQYLGSIPGTPFIGGVNQFPLLYNQYVAWFLPKPEATKLQNCQ